ncbi:hypothetical protein DL96DRAFT_1657023 [Flagelloscypha sp. PMI_526]|nr:hypothetical protein DL96DRAFT_1657023 [Flagelloscypha sp. PMI_526]
MATDSPYDLPIELWTKVFLSCDNFYSLVSLSATSCYHRATYLDNLSTLLQGVAYNELGEVLPHLLHYLSSMQEVDEFQFHPKNMKAYFDAVRLGYEWMDAIQSYHRGWRDPGIPANYIYSANDLTRLQRAIFNFWTFVVIWKCQGDTSAQEYLNDMSLSSYQCLTLAGIGAHQIGLRIMKDLWHPRYIEQLTSIYPEMLGILIRAQKDDPSSLLTVIESSGHHIYEFYRTTPYEVLHVRFERLPRQRQFGGWIICEPIMELWRKWHASITTS